MSDADGHTFEVMFRDVHGDPVRCSFCARPVPCVVVLHRIPEPDGSDLWLGVCAFCVLAMAKTLASHTPPQNTNETP